SRRHAILHVGAKLEVEDVGSTNGTRVGGRELDAGQRCSVKIGDTMELGSVVMVVVALAAERAKPSPQLTSHTELAPRSVAGPMRGKVDPPKTVVTSEPVMLRIYQLARRAAASNISVLILGETGSGKEILAESIHHNSPRNSKPLLRLNCSALADSLLESELFGHEK